MFAQALQRRGYGSECATWRNCFLTGAHELRCGIIPTPFSASAGMAQAMTVTQLFDTIAIRIDGPRAADTALSVLWHFTDSGERYLMEPSNGVLIHHPTQRTPETDLTLTLAHPQLLGLLRPPAGRRLPSRHGQHKGGPRPTAARRSTASTAHCCIRPWRSSS